MYSAVHYRIRRLKQHTGHPYGVAYVLFFMAFVVRSFRLEQNPLWLDEIYGYQLGRLGISGILRNSLVDPHPPLYYFIQWIVSGFGAFHTEWAWRSLF